MLNDFDLSAKRLNQSNNIEFVVSGILSLVFFGLFGAKPYWLSILSQETQKNPIIVDLFFFFLTGASAYAFKNLILNQDDNNANPVVVYHSIIKGNKKRTIFVVLFSCYLFVVLGFVLAIVSVFFSFFWMVFFLLLVNASIYALQFFARFYKCT